MKDDNIQKRMKLKAKVAFVVNFLVNKKAEHPIKMTIMKITYLLHSKYGVTFAKYYGYLFGPYSKAVDTALESLNGVAFDIEEKVTHDGERIFVFSNATLPTFLMKYLDEEEIAKLENALEEIYARFSHNGRLSLEKILEYIYNEDEHFKKTRLGEEIVVE